MKWCFLVFSVLFCTELWSSERQEKCKQYAQIVSQAAGVKNAGHSLSGIESSFGQEYGAEMEAFVASAIEFGEQNSKLRGSTLRARAIKHCKKRVVRK